MGKWLPTSSLEPHFSPVPALPTRPPTRHLDTPQVCKAGRGGPSGVDPTPRREDSLPHGDRRRACGRLPGAVTASLSKPSRFETCCSQRLTVRGKRQANEEKDIHYSPAGGFDVFTLCPAPDTRLAPVPHAASGGERVRWGHPPRSGASASDAHAAFCLHSGPGGPGGLPGGSGRPGTGALALNRAGKQARFKVQH